ncbi:MAG: hypothetical protein AAFO82_19455, partial [Bacteroidota bacterium]
ENGFLGKYLCGIWGGFLDEMVVDFGEKGGTQICPDTCPKCYDVEGEKIYFHSNALRAFE